MFECLNGSFTDTNIFADTNLDALIGERTGKRCGL